MTHSPIQALRDRLDAEGINIADGIAIAEHLATEAGITLDTLHELIARDLEERGEWPEDQGVSGSDLAAWMDHLGTEDLGWLNVRIQHVAAHGL